MYDNNNKGFLFDRASYWLYTLMEHKIYIIRHINLTQSSQKIGIHVILTEILINKGKKLLARLKAKK